MAKRERSPAAMETGHSDDDEKESSSLSHPRKEKPRESSSSSSHSSLSPSRAPALPSPPQQQQRFARSKKMKLVPLGAYRASQYLNVILMRGSVVDFGSTPDFDEYPRSAAIVNAANEGCLGGGGVDGALNRAGGLRLENARLSLPIVANPGIRCPTGQAVVTGPDVYGDLKVPYIIHAVGPNYHDFDEEDTPKGHALLRSAYQASLDLAYKHQIHSVGFSLLSSGIYRGPILSLEDVLAIGLEGLQQWKPPVSDDNNSNGSNKSTKQFTPHACLCAFTAAECNTLATLCDDMLEKLQNKK